VHVGIVGLGGGASDMIPAFVQHPHIALTAAADIDTGQLEKFRSEFQGRPTRVHRHCVTIPTSTWSTLPPRINSISSMP
jgi:phthalate 4,5-cis-dihydrodiol dehydrogenase